MAPVKVSKKVSEPTTSAGSIPSRPRRGRPSGANRIPLSREERLARNKLYERERRNVNGEAYEELRKVCGCDSSMSMAEVIKFVTAKLKSANEEPSIEEYMKINSNLEAEIARCKQLLGADCDPSSGDEEEGICVQTNKRRLSQPDTTCSGEKRMAIEHGPYGERIPASGPSFTAAEPQPVPTLPPSPPSFIPAPLSSSLPSGSLPTPSPPTPLAEQDIALLFSPDQLQIIYDALDSADQREMTAVQDITQLFSPDDLQKIFDVLDSADQLS